jgi:hypothetical protein
MWQKISIAAAILLFLGARGLRGVWTDSTPSGVLQEAVARMDRLPQVIGGWQGEDQEVDADAILQGRLVGHLMRRYHHSSTGEVVSILLVCGRPGPISVHTPDACYTGAGWEMLGAPVRVGFHPPEASAAEFWTVRFAKAGAPIPERLRIYWAWNAAGLWEASSNPRFAFVRAPALYKLYVVGEVSPSNNAPEKDPCLGFMQELLPELGKALAP